MARLRLPLAVITPVAALLLGSSITVQACPFKDGQRLDSAFSQTGQPSRLSDAARRPDNLRRSSLLDMSEFAGLGVFLGLLTIAIRSKMRHIRELSPSESDFLSKYPFLEHPEMVLTLVPQEALSSAVEAEGIPARW